MTHNSQALCYGKLSVAALHLANVDSPDIFLTILVDQRVNPIIQPRHDAPLVLYSSEDSLS